VFFACDPETFEGRCANEKEITAFFTDNYILTAQNAERFDASDYTGNFIKKETQINNLYLSQYASPRYFIDLQQNKVETNDDRSGFSSGTEATYYSVFTSKTGTLPDEYPKAYIAYWY